MEGGKDNQFFDEWSLLPTVDSSARDAKRGLHHLLRSKWIHLDPF